jgi:beta-mannosidase
MRASLNDCLSLFPVQALNRQALASGWRMAVATLGEGEDHGYAQLTHDDDAWSPVAVPRLHGATTGHEAIWYRVRFPRPKHRQRTLLRFDGAFLTANVWLNGRLLGSHYGYFAPFSFDISSFLLDENVLAVCVEAPVELDLAGKRHVMGIFNDWDCKPYPSRELGQLPEHFVWHVPMGLWQPVYLEQVGHVVAEWIHCEPSVERGDVARLGLRLRLRNLDSRIMTGEMAIRIESEHDADSAPLEMRRSLRLNGHDVQEVAVEVALPNPRLWWPWSQGEAALYRAVVEVMADERSSAQIRQVFGIRDTVLDTRADGWKFRINSRPIFVRGANYCSEFFLDAVTEETAAADLTLAREANMDMLRVHAHVEPQAVYDVSDRTGVMLWQDFPLIFSYVHRADPRSVAFFRDAVLSQVEEMAHLLYNHPSVVCYAMHNEPAWCTAFARLGERHTEQLNRDVDEEAVAHLRELDPSRPTIVASGDQDDHLYLGWYEGHWRDLADRAPLFVSEVGAQALPNATSPVWRHLNRSWPVSDDDPSWRFAGYQPAQWQRSGIGPPSAHPSREAYIRASQEYQAHLLRFAIQRFRALKFSPCGGVLIFQLVDCFPGIGWAILDHARRPKRAFRAVAEAFAPVLLIAELPEADVRTDGLLLRLPRGRALRLRLVCVNDDPLTSGPARLRWRIARERAGATPWWQRLKGRLARRRFRGQELIELPSPAEPAVVLAEPVLRFQANGVYRLSAELEARGQVLARLDQRFAVGAPSRPDHQLQDEVGVSVPLDSGTRPIAARR